MGLAFTILLARLDEGSPSHLIPILASQGYLVRTAEGLETLLATLSRSIDLVILDLPASGDMPQIEQIRATCACPLLVIGPARNDRLLVQALEHGADDYVQRPYRTNELLARVRAQLRRHERTLGFSLSFGPLTIDPQARQATCNGVTLDLTPEEFVLLATLAARPGYACPAPLLLEQVWGHGRRDDAELLRAAIERLRALIEPEPTAPTVLGGSTTQGYWLGGISQARELNGE